MNITMKTGLAALVLMLAVSCRKDNTLLPEPNSDERVAQTETASTESLSINAVSVGRQIWQKRDLSVTKYRNGDKIPQVQNPDKWAKLTTGAWCYYNNDPKNGILYNWYAVNDLRGLAPKGWHVPTDDEWTALTNFLGGYELAGGKLKEAGTAHWKEPNADATNSTGFTALPGGTRDYLGSFFDAGGYGYWWSSTEASDNSAFHRYLTYFYGAISGTTDYKGNGFSVRCIHN